MLLLALCCCWNCLYPWLLAVGATATHSSPGFSSAQTQAIPSTLSHPLTSSGQSLTDRHSKIKAVAPLVSSICTVKSSPRSPLPTSYLLSTDITLLFLFFLSEDVSLILGSNSILYTNIQRWTWIRGKKPRSVADFARALGLPLLQNSDL